MHRFLCAICPPIFAPKLRRALMVRPWRHPCTELVLGNAPKKRQYNKLFSLPHKTTDGDQHFCGFCVVGTPARDYDADTRSTYDHQRCEIAASARITSGWGPMVEAMGLAVSLALCLFFSFLVQFGLRSSGAHHMPIPMAIRRFKNAPKQGRRRDESRRSPPQPAIPPPPSAASKLPRDGGADLIIEERPKIGHIAGQWLLVADRKPLTSETYWLSERNNVASRMAFTVCKRNV